MIITTLHETIFAYEQPVSFTFTQTRLRPVSDDGQTCHEFSITIDPDRPLTEAYDYYGNQIHSFNILQPHRTHVVTSRSVVETHRNPFAEKTPLSDFEIRKAQHEFCSFSGPVEDIPPVHQLAAEAGLFDAGDPFAAAQELNRLIFERFTFAPEATHVDSSIADVLADGRGVCQDFAHVFIAACRAASIPARYVSGYLVTRRSLSAEGSPASHAWTEALLPGHGWCGFDPTNNLLANDYYVKIAAGRDYRDVAPTRGIYTGPGIDGMLQVRVHMQIDGESLPRVEAEVLNHARVG